MRKNVVQDVVPPSPKKSIRDIDVPARREVEKKVPKYSPKDDPFERPVSINQSINQSPIKIESTDSYKMPPPPTPPTNPHKFEYPSSGRKSSKKKLVYVLAILVVLGLAFLVSGMFKSATIQVTPKQETKNLNETFIAKKDATGAGLGFQVVTTSKDIEKSVDPKDVASEQKVEKKARGTIVIYNNFGTASQKLIATTRFETPEGLVYRLIEAVTVPGKTTVAGKTTPGSIEAVVEADKAGANYNVGLKDFTIPGLKTDAAKYKEMYGRSKTEMTGGFSGMQKVVTKDVLTKAEIEMENTLKSTLSKDIVSQIPSDFVLYEKSLTYKFEPAVSATNASGAVVLKKKGTTSAVIFGRSSLTKAILAKVLPDAGENLVKINNLNSLTFNLATSSQITGSSINFTLSGSANLEWIFDEAKLKNDLLGLSKTNANTILTQYPSIKEAWITTKPFWNTSIPNDPKKVTLINSLTVDGTQNGI